MELTCECGGKVVELMFISDVGDPTYSVAGYRCTDCEGQMPVHRIGGKLISPQCAWCGVVRFGGQIYHGGRAYCDEECRDENEDAQRCAWCDEAPKSSALITGGRLFCDPQCEANWLAGESDVRDSARLCTYCGRLGAGITQKGVEGRFCSVNCSLRRQWRETAGGCSYCGRTDAGMIHTGVRLGDDLYCGKSCIEGDARHRKMLAEAEQRLANLPPARWGFWRCKRCGGVADASTREAHGDCG